MDPASLHRTAAYRGPPRAKESSLSSNLRKFLLLVAAL